MLSPRRLIQMLTGRLIRRPRLLAGLALVVAGAPLVYTTLEVVARGAPVPQIHDEFTYLFAGETFAQGRLTNPSHPLWEFFETFHILPLPTRTSKFPVLQGLTLAAGRIVFDESWAAVLLVTCLMLGALYWALTPWVPRQWALLGVCLAALRFGANHYWITSYWGGSAAALGGCLLFGVAGRLRRGPERQAPKRLALNGLLLGLGLAILANSRPWEGLLLSLAVVPYIGSSLFAGRAATTASFRRAAALLLPCGLIVLAAGAAMARYNDAATGDWKTMPYSLYQARYSVEPIFPWDHKGPTPHYNHLVTRRFFTKWEPRHQVAPPTASLLGRIANRVYVERNVFKDLLGSLPALVVVALMGPYLLWNRRSRPVAVILLLVMCGMMLQRYHAAHYRAPLLAGLVLLKVMAYRRLAFISWRSAPVGVGVAALLIVADAGLSLFLPSGVFRPGCMDRRPAIEAALREAPGRDLIVVSYVDAHNLHCEWVYNEPDIDAAEVVWAREMTRERNCELTRYFSDRKVWLFQPDLKDSEPVPALDWCAAR